MEKRREIRNSTAEFLIFQIEGKEQGIEVFYKDKTVWCTQKAMGMLFDCTSDNISVHLQNIYDTDELKKEATTEKISVVRREGNRDVNRTLQFYNLDAIISVGYRVNSIRATQFRQFILVSNGVIPSRFFLHGKVERRAIGRIGDQLYYIATRHKETLWDFADALREFGFPDAIYITGGTDYCFYRDKAGIRHDIGNADDYPHTKWQGIIPWLVYRKNG